MMSDNFYSEEVYAEDPVKYLENPIEKTEILNEDSTFILTGYFWGKDTVNKNSVRGLTYGQQVERLIEQCKKYNVNYYFAEYPVFKVRNIYQIGLGLKGEFISKCLERFPKYKVINIDTDLSLQQYPVLFDMDVDCFFLNWNEIESKCYNPFQVELPGGILGFANTHNAKTMLKILNGYMINHLYLAEDKSFSGIITRHFMNTYVRCLWLPLNYMYMFSAHKYDPKIGKYTHVASIEEELESADYKKDDLVLIHEDFETGELDDVFEHRIGKVNRWPPNVYRQLGEKLRCIKIKFKNYIDFNTTAAQYQHLKVDAEWRQSEGLIRNVQIKKFDPFDIKEKDICYSTLTENGTSPIIISLKHRDTTSEAIARFVDSCKKFGLECIVYDQSKKLVDKPVFFQAILKKYKRNIAFIDIHTYIKQDPKLFGVRNMDFMTINADNTSIDGNICSDMRVLKTVNDNLYFFAYNDVVLQFLDIWAEHNKRLTNQHKGLEHAFNISMAINKLRCFWLPSTYLVGGVLKYDPDFTYSFFNNTYLSKQIRHLTRSIQQCGLKPALQDGEPKRTHHFGSLHGSIYHNRYGKQFLEF
jgi:hypothetical protein